MFKEKGITVKDALENMDELNLSLQLSAGKDNPAGVKIAVHYGLYLNTVKVLGT